MQRADEKRYKEAEALWKEFGDVAIDSKENITEDWHGFKKGTNRYEIWTWFEEQFNLSVAIDLMHLEAGTF